MSADSGFCGAYTGSILTKDVFITHEVQGFSNPAPQNETPQVKTKKTLKDLPTINMENKPLMGVSYIFGTCAETFCCMLCEKSFHMNLIIGHVTGNSHRMDYCVSKFHHFLEI
jgi:hypothetical protein